MQFSLRTILLATTLIAVGVWLMILFPYNALFVAFYAGFVLSYFALLRVGQLFFQWLARRHPPE